MNDIVVNLKNIDKSYNAGKGIPPEKVLTGVNLILKHGDNAAVIGPSGCGKTTLLNIIGAMDTPDSGIVEINNINIGGYNISELARIRNKTIGFVFQQHRLLPQCTALENVLLPTLVNTKKQQKYEAEIYGKELLARVGLADKQHKFPFQLSGGECQRVSVVRALINKPKILLADEPTGSLDRANALELIKLLLNLNKEYNSTLLIATHSSLLVEELQNTFTLSNGKLHQIVSPSLL